MNCPLMRRRMNPYPQKLKRQSSVRFVKRSAFRLSTEVSFGTAHCHQSKRRNSKPGMLRGSMLRKPSLCRSDRHGSIKESGISKEVLFSYQILRRTNTMKELWTTIQLIFAGIGGWLGWFLGGCDGLLFALVAFVVIDYITGIMCAVVDKKLSSTVGFKGIFKKVLIFALVGVGHILDTRVIGAGSVLRTAVIFFYLSNEGISLLENAAYLGLPIPKKLKSVLEQLHDRSEKEDE
nr:MAG TPA: holin [Caudoviricetes sp.]